MKHFISAALAVGLLVALSFSAQAQGFEEPPADPNELRQCARAFCQELRNCETYIPQPGGGEDVVGVRTPDTRKPNADPAAQGEVREGSCRWYAFDDYQGCTSEFEGQGIVKPVEADRKTVKTKTEGTTTPDSK